MCANLLIPTWLLTGNMKIAAIVGIVALGTAGTSSIIAATQKAGGFAKLSSLVSDWGLGAGISSASSSSWVAIKAFGQLFTKIPGLASQAGSKISDFSSTAWTFASTHVPKIPEYLKQSIAGIKKALDGSASAYSKFSTLASTYWSTIKTKITTTWPSVKATATGLWTKFQTQAKSITPGSAHEGIKTIAKTTLQVVKVLPSLAPLLKPNNLTKIYKSIVALVS